MLHHLNLLRGLKLAARDGLIGSVKDFLFDDKSWAVRYLVADTGTWLSHRQILLSPFSFESLDSDGKVLNVNLTRQQIESSPSLEEHRPVSRQFEQSYHLHYGWPSYWHGTGLWGQHDLPIMTPVPVSSQSFTENFSHWDDLHLRSSHRMKGYDIQATDGAFGTVSDFMIDKEKWQIREIAVETGHWYSGKIIQVPVDQVERISGEEAKIFIHLSKQDLLSTHENQTAVAHH